MNMEAELQRALLPKDTRICPHPEQFSPLSVKILETPSGSSPTPQFLTFLAAPSAAQLSPRRTRCHQLSPFFHPVSFGARKPCFGGRRAVASTPFATAKSQLGDTSPWAYFAPAFLFRCNLPFFQTLKHPRAANLNFPGGGPGCSAQFGSDQPGPGRKILAPSASPAGQRCWKLGEAGCWPGCCTEAQEKAKGDEGGTVPAVQRELSEGFVLSIPLPPAPHPWLRIGRI